ncbi:hypothetical protein AJ87_07420 [Rhizobium yanglingense]|nr:hypothetical protein AJ87_07420 [Rhizobium yanglingense]
MTDCLVPEGERLDIVKGELSTYTRYLARGQISRAHDAANFRQSRILSGDIDGDVPQVTGDRAFQATLNNRLFRLQLLCNLINDRLENGEQGVSEGLEFIRHFVSCRRKELLDQREVFHDLLPITIPFLVGKLVVAGFDLPLPALDKIGGNDKRSVRPAFSRRMHIACQCAHRSCSSAASSSISSVRFEGLPAIRWGS